MSKEKISRKKLLQEPDEFLSLSQQVWLWVHRNRDKALMIVGGIATVVLLVLGAKSYVEHSSSRRAGAVSAAVARYTQAPDGVIPADLQQELGTLADRYAGSPEGAVARFFQAGALAASGEVEKARTMYTTLAAPVAPDGDLAVLARAALAYLDLVGGSDDAALAAFENLLKTQGVAVPRAQIMMDVASVHEKHGRRLEASRVYQNLLAEFPDGSWAAPARERLRVLTELGTAAS